MLNERLEKLIDIRLAGGEAARKLVAMDRVLASHLFRSAPESSKLFRHLAEESALGNLVCEVSVGVELLRGDYDPEKDSTVRVRAKALRKRLLLYYQTEGENDRFQLRFRPFGYGVYLADTEAELADVREELLAARIRIMELEEQLRSLKKTTVAAGA